MRVQLSGKGEPIPLEALPGLTTDTDFPPKIFVLSTGAFLKTDWVTLGYTNYEVSCIGAAGGRGGDVYDPFVNWPYYIVETPGGTYSYIVHYYDPFLDPPLDMGGGGGGGGYHHAAGLLADLPDSTPVVVGVAGAHGADGVVGKETVTEVFPPDMPPNSFLDDHFFVGAAAVGGDGGASSFNGALCRASGGKGGHPGRKWVAHVESKDSVGGQGGIGDQLVAGGGAAGSTALANNGVDGVLTDEIGEGGGGGFGGKYTKAFTDTFGLSHPPVVTPASNGGQGSYSFGDLSVFGARGAKDTLTIVYDNVHYPGSAHTNVYGGILPGGGGGAKVGTSVKAGSSAPGFDPNGAVILRIFKAE